MVRNRYSAYYRRNRKFNIFDRSNRIPLTAENILLIVLPLILMLVLIPPKKEDKPAVLEKEASAGKASVSIVVYNHADAVIDEVPLEDYLIGVVAAEMPHTFNFEALKAQAVAARTFVLSRMQGLYGSKEKHYGADVCTDPGHCQSWISRERFLESYGNEDDWQKICRAVSETGNIVITYEGVLINPLYHSNSGGVTEDIEDVWTNVDEVPYLKSVYSPYEEDYSQYEKTTVFSWDEIKSKVGKRYPEAKLGNEAVQDFEILSWSSSGRVDKARLGSAIITGTELRELLGLRSTNLEINFLADNSIEIISRGYGHGVGMSQCGADALASHGYDFEEILKFYYTGVTVEEIRY
ncbi:MAG TPA: stage II sporulation protein D [Clostridiaceae bacterium]|nr:stage II sporulation protein D [Clostridiaceae bacterium]